MVAIRWLPWFSGVDGPLRHKDGLRPGFYHRLLGHLLLRPGGQVRVPAGGRRPGRGTEQGQKRDIHEQVGVKLRGSAAFARCRLVIVLPSGCPPSSHATANQPGPLARSEDLFASSCLLGSSGRSARGSGIRRRGARNQRRGRRLPHTACRRDCRGKGAAEPEPSPPHGHRPRRSGCSPNRSSFGSPPPAGRPQSDKRTHRGSSRAPRHALARPAVSELSAKPPAR